MGCGFLSFLLQNCSAHFPMGSKGAGALCLAGISLGLFAHIPMGTGQPVTYDRSQGPRASLARFQRCVQGWPEEAALS